MKKIIALLAMTISVAAVAATPKRVETKASDSHITYIGRTLTGEDGSVSFDWSATTVKVAFTGNYLAMKVSDTHRNFYNLYIDREPSELGDATIITSGSDTTIVLATKAGKGRHTATLVKRTEGEQGTTTIKSFVSEGPLLQASPLKERMIEFVGDSYTCGYGSDSRDRNDPFMPETENASATYASIISRYFNADFMAIAHSGQGIARNYDDFGKGWYMPDRYLCTFDTNREVKWDAACCDFKPALTVIYLGTNDFSTGRQPAKWMFIDYYVKLLKAIKANYGEAHPVLCIASPASPELFDYVREAATTSGLSNITYTGAFNGIYSNETELGASWHPSYLGHIKLASMVIPYISTITGWPMSGELK